MGHTETNRRVVADLPREGLNFGFLVASPSFVTLAERPVNKSTTSPKGLTCAVLATVSAAAPREINDDGMTLCCCCFCAGLCYVVCVWAVFCMNSILGLSKSIISTFRNMEYGNAACAQPYKY